MHAIISGVTESGKTTLARSLARNFAKQGQNVIVYDPVGTGTLGGGWPESAVIFDDEEELFSYLARDDVSHSHVFIDEAGEIFSVPQKHNMWLLTRGRHFGLYCYLICQRPKMVAPNARSQCSRAYMFRLAHEDASEISRDFGHSWPYFDEKGTPEKELDKGDFFVLYSGRKAKSRANVFNLINPKGRTP